MQNNVILCVGMVCVLVIISGVLKAWGKTNKSIALIPVYILVIGRVIIPFIIGYTGMHAPPFVFQFTDILLATIIGLYFLVKHK